MNNQNNNIKITVIKWDEYQTRKDLKSMSWFRLDASLPEHPAFFELNSDGKWLFIYILCLCAKNNSNCLNTTLNYLSYYSKIKEQEIKQSIQILHEHELIRYEFNTNSLPTEHNITEHNNTKTEQNVSPKKNKHGEFKNVMLTEEDFNKLQIKFGEGLKHWIRQLDEYIEQKGNKYKNHYLTILKWSERENKNTFKKPQGSSKEEVRSFLNELSRGDNND